MTNAPDLAERAGYLISLAARAPSVHNTQPWRFEVSERAIELYADASRQLLEDPAGREMLISCGAACTGCGWGSGRWATGPRSNCSPGPPCWPGCAWGFRRP
jgi:nitroreductase